MCCFFLLQLGKGVRAVKAVSTRLSLREARTSSSPPANGVSWWNTVYDMISLWLTLETTGTYTRYSGYDRDYRLKMCSADVRTSPPLKKEKKKECPYLTSECEKVSRVFRDNSTYIYNRCRIFGLSSITIDWLLLLNMKHGESNTDWFSGWGGNKAKTFTQ